MEAEPRFQYMTNTETGGTTWVPLEDGVVEWHEAHGWEKTPPPPEVPFVPSVPDVPETEATWVTMFHPAIKASHDFPNNPDALQGALDAGWTFPEANPQPEEALPVNEPPQPPAGDEKASAPAKATTKKEGK